MPIKKIPRERSNSLTKRIPIKNGKKFASGAFIVYNEMSI